MKTETYQKIIIICDICAMIMIAALIITIIIYSKPLYNKLHPFKEIAKIPGVICTLNGIMIEEFRNENNSMIYSSPFASIDLNSTIKSFNESLE